MTQSLVRQSLLLLLFFFQCQNSYSQCEIIDSLLAHAQRFDEVALEERIATLEEVISIAQSCQDTSRTIEAIISLSSQHGNVGNYQASFKNFWKALLLVEDSKNINDRFKLYVVIGNNYGYLQRPEKSIEFFEKAKALIPQFEADSDQAYFAKLNLFQSYIGLYRQLEQFDEVSQYIDSLSLYIQEDEYNFQYYFLQVEKAMYANHLGEYDNALELLNESKQFFAKNEPTYLVLINTFIGDVYFNKMNYPQSENYYNSAIELGDRTQKHIDFTPKIYQRLAKLYSVMGKDKSALKAANKSAELNFKFFDSRSPMHTSLTEVQDEFKILKEEQKQFRQDQELQTLYQNKRLYIFQLLLLLGTLLFSLIFAFFYSRWQKNIILKEKEYNNSLEKEYMLKKDLSEKLATKNEELVTYSHIMSHDLKTPINTIKSFSSLLKKQIQDEEVNPQSLDYINFISSSSDSMSQLIDDLILYSKLESDDTNLKEIDLNTVLEKVVSGFNHNIEEKDASISIQELPKVKGNDGILKTVFYNLISNGLKYQPINKENHKPNIKIWAVSNSAQNIIYVKDNGIGFSEDSKESLFLPFKRFHASSEYKGTGLGMSICKRIMQSHNGDIELKETSKDGSTFKLIFPN